MVKPIGRSLRTASPTLSAYSSNDINNKFWFMIATMIFLFDYFFLQPIILGQTKMGYCGKHPQTGRSGTWSEEAKK